MTRAGERRPAHGPTSMAVRVLAGTVLVCGLAACGGGGGPSDLTLPSSATTVAPAATTSSAAINPPATRPGGGNSGSAALIARATVPQVLVYAAPGAARPLRVLSNPWLAVTNDPTARVPQVFLVEAQQRGWVQVLLPVRPNGSTGWVSASDVKVTQVGFRVRVRVGARRITVFDRGKVISHGPAAVGAPAAPTPTGRYYIRARLKAPSRKRTFGPFAFGLASRTTGVTSFSGDDAEIAILGNADATVLGRAVTRGSVRIANAQMIQLATVLPLGTPVDIIP